MKIYIIGTGGLGGFFGGMLARNGEDVSFLARGEHYETIKKDGLQIRSVAEGSFTVFPAQVIQSFEELHQPDLIIYAVKTYSNENIAKALHGKLKPETVVLTFQNGIDSDQQIIQYSGHPKVYPGIAYIISTKTAPGIIEQTGGPRKLIFGERQNQANPELKNIAELMRNAHIDATYIDKGIETKLWEKYIFINAFSGFTAAFQSPIGALREDPAVFDLYKKSMEETLQLAKSQGIQLEEDIVSRYLQFTQNLESNANSSLYHDVINQGPNELEALNATVYRLGKKNGIDVRVNQFLYSMIKHTH